MTEFSDCHESFFLCFLYPQSFHKSLIKSLLCIRHYSKCREHNKQNPQLLRLYEWRFDIPLFQLGKRAQINSVWSTNTGDPQLSRKETEKESCVFGREWRILLSVLHSVLRFWKRPLPPKSGFFHFLFYFLSLYYISSDLFPVLQVLLSVTSFMSLTKLLMEPSHWRCLKYGMQTLPHVHLVFIVFLSWCSPQTIKW